MKSQTASGTYAGSSTAEFFPSRKL